jgi:hypothetical protein
MTPDYKIVFYDVLTNKEIEELGIFCNEQNKERIILQTISKVVRKYGENITFLIYKRDEADCKWEDFNIPVSMVRCSEEDMVIARDREKLRRLKEEVRELEGA